MELLHVCGSAICAAESVITGEVGDLPGPRRPLGAAGQPIAAAPVCFSLLKSKPSCSLRNSVYRADD